MCIANSIEEINSALELENNVIDFIWRNKEVLSEHIEEFYKLEPHDDMLLTNQEVLDLKCFAQTLLNFKNIERLNFCKDEVYEEYYVLKEEYLYNELFILFIKSLFIIFIFCITYFVSKI